MMINPDCEVVVDDKIIARISKLERAVFHPYESMSTEEARRHQRLRPLVQRQRGDRVMGPWRITTTYRSGGYASNIPQLCVMRCDARFLHQVKILIDINGNRVGIGESFFNVPYSQTIQRLDSICEAIDHLLSMGGWSLAEPYDPSSVAAITALVPGERASPVQAPTGSGPVDDAAIEARLSRLEAVVSQWSGVAAWPPQRLFQFWRATKSADARLADQLYAWRLRHGKRWDSIPTLQCSRSQVCLTLADEPVYHDGRGARLDWGSCPVASFGSMQEGQAALGGFLDCVDEVLRRVGVSLSVGTGEWIPPGPYLSRSGSVEQQVNWWFALDARSDGSYAAASVGRFGWSIKLFSDDGEVISTESHSADSLDVEALKVEALAALRSRWDGPDPGDVEPPQGS